MAPSPSGIVYVFLARPRGVDRKERVAELRNRCFVARGLNKDAVTVIGIATEQYVRGEGFSLDVAHLISHSLVLRRRVFRDTLLCIV